MKGGAWNRLNQMKQLQNLLVVVALGFVVLMLYPFSPSTLNSPTYFQYVGAFGIVAVAIAAIFVYYLRPSQKRPGEQVSY